MESSYPAVSKFGSCPYCYGKSIVFTLFFLLLFIIAALSSASVYIKYSLLTACVVFLIWTLLHIAFFIARFYKTIKPLSLSATKKTYHVLKVTYIFTKSSVLLILKPERMKGVK